MTLLLIFRYMFSRSNHHRSRVIRIMAGLAISTMIMLSIISLMDYMQSRGTEPLREIKSFPLVVSVSDAQDAGILCEEYSGIAEVFPYKEEKGLMSDASGTRGVVIRYIDDSYDGALMTSTGTVPQNGIYLPFRSYVRGFSDNVSITSLVQGRAVRMIPRTRTYAVEGLYQTVLSDFDSQYVFLPLCMSDESLEWKVAFRNVMTDEDELASHLEAEGWDVTMWYESESIYCSALMLEKTVMSVLLSSLYVIVLVQSVQNASMLASGKRREVTALHLTGFSKGKLTLVFSLTGFFIALLSLIAGLVLAELFLKAFPYITGLYGRYSIDWTYFCVISVAMLVLSSAVYGLAFLRKLGEDTAVEVLNAI